MLNRDVTDRERIWHEFWNIDRHLTFFPVFPPGPIDAHGIVHAPGKPWLGIDDEIDWAEVERTATDHFFLRA